MTKLHILDSLPAGLFDTPAQQLHTLLDGPSLLRIPGQANPPLFISVLLHGNETSGWEALCRLMQERAEELDAGRLPRSIMLFIGNVAAAAQNLRSLPGQADFNRLWKGNTEHPELVQALMAEVAAQPLFVALDLHNNTGRNPHYTVLTEITPESSGLAYLFSDKAVLVDHPDSFLGRAMQKFCPATTVELGKVGDPTSADRAYQLLHAYLELEEVPTESTDSLNLHRSVARVRVIDDAAFDFADEMDLARLSEDDLVLTAGMEAVNFHPVPAGTEFGFTRKPLAQTLRVLDPQDRDVTEQYLEEVHGDVSLVQAVIPAMYTTDHAVIRQDCLCYFMEKI